MLPHTRPLPTPEARAARGQTGRIAAAAVQLSTAAEGCRMMIVDRQTRFVSKLSIGERKRRSSIWIADQEPLRPAHSTIPQLPSLPRNKVLRVSRC